MRHILPAIAIALLTVPTLLLGMTATAQAQRMDASVACNPTGNNLEYRCEISLFEAQSNDPVEGAEFVVRADMPAMPMAHNVPPVQARALDEPGRYEAVLELEMYGVWALRLDIAAPRRDIVVVTKDFDDGDDEHDHDH